jgi:hypothetical protein
LKFDYNKDLKEYNYTTKQIQREENNLEDIKKQIAKIHYKQNMRLCSINVEFINHFNQFTKNIRNDIVESFLEFLGLSKTPYSIVIVMDC